jgi:flagellar export protein FliJ
MARFKFRLATLLRLREAARDERRAQLAEAYRADEILAHERSRLARELRELERQTRQASAPGQIDVDRLLETRRYEMALQSQGLQLAQKHEAVQLEIERRREALADANREVRVLETLRQKQLDHHRHEESRREIKTLDETATRRAAKNDAEENEGSEMRDEG